MTVIGQGQWVLSREKWKFVGKSMTKAVLIEEAITFSSVKEKILQRFGKLGGGCTLRLSYKPPHMGNLHPMDVSDEDDWEGFKFVNRKSVSGVWSVNLYASFELVEPGRPMGREELTVGPSTPAIRSKFEKRIAELEERVYRDEGGGCSEGKTDTSPDVDVDVGFLAPQTTEAEFSCERGLSVTTERVLGGAAEGDRETVFSVGTTHVRNMKRGRQENVVDLSSDEYKPSSDRAQKKGKRVVVVSTN